MTDTLDDVRTRYDLPSVIGRYVDNVSRKMVCPFPDHRHTANTPSLSLYQSNGVQRFKCHGHCGHRGDAIDFVGYMEIPGYDGRNAMHVARARALLENNAPRPARARRVRLPRQKPPLRQNTVKHRVLRWHEELKYPPAMQYLAGRGISYLAVRKYKLGYRYYGAYELPEHRVGGHYIAIPTFKGDRLVGVKFRRLENVHRGETPLRYRSFSSRQHGTSGVGVFGYNDIVNYPGISFSPEGELDAILVYSLSGYPVACTNAGARSLPDEFKAMRDGLPIFLAEGDETGRTHAEAKRDLVGRGYIECIPYGDVGQFYAAKGGRVVQAWLRSLLEKYGQGTRRRSS